MYLGILKSFTVDATRVILDFESHKHAGGYEDQVVMHPKGVANA